MPYQPQPDPNSPASPLRTARNVAWNYLGYSYQIAINIGLTWYVVRKVSVSEYGLFVFVMSLSASLYLLDIGISSVLVQLYIEASALAGPERVNRLLSTAFLALTTLGIVGVSVFCGLAASLPGPFNIPHAYLHEAFLIFVIAAFIILIGFSTIAIEQVYQASHRFDRTSQIQLSAGTLQIALSIYVLASGHGIVALASIQLIASIFRFVFLIVALPASVPGVHFGSTKFDPDLLRSLLRLGKWAFLSNLSSGLFEVLVWTVLGSFSSMEQAAIFGLANKLPRQLWNVIDKGGTVVFPHLSASSVRGDQLSLRRMYLDTQRLLTGGVLPFILLGCFAARPLVQVWAGSQYLGAAVVLQILLLGVASHVTGYCSNQVLYASGEIKKAATITVWEYVISLVVAVILVPRYGALGLAAGMAAGQIFVNCTWLTWAACKLSGTSAQALLRSVLADLKIPTALLCIAMAAIWCASSFLGPVWKLLSVLVSGCVYFVFWGRRSLSTARRAESESVA